MPKNEFKTKQSKYNTGNSCEPKKTKAEIEHINKVFKDNFIYNAF